MLVRLGSSSKGRGDNKKICKTTTQRCLAFISIVSGAAIAMRTNLLVTVVSCGRKAFEYPWSCFGTFKSHLHEFSKASGKKMRKVIVAEKRGYLLTWVQLKRMIIVIYPWMQKSSESTQLIWSVAGFVPHQPLQSRSCRRSSCLSSLGKPTVGRHAPSEQTKHRGPVNTQVTEVEWSAVWWYTMPDMCSSFHVDKLTTLSY